MKKDIITSECGERKENIFIFSCRYDGGTFDIVRDYEATTSTVKDDTYNVKLSPAQCALRWVDLLFTLNGQTKFSYTSGTGLVDVKAIPIQDNEYLSDNNKDGNFKENSDLLSSYAQKIVTPEVVSITYPISLSQYNEIMNDPYGVVLVDGERFWILEFEYSFVDGESTFKLLKIK